MKTTPVQLMILAVVQDQDLDTTTRALGDLGAPVVYLASSGGFLGRRNATVLIGLPSGSGGACAGDAANDVPAKGGVHDHAG